MPVTLSAFSIAARTPSRACAVKEGNAKKNTCFPLSAPEEIFSGKSFKKPFSSSKPLSFKKASYFSSSTARSESFKRNNPAASCSSALAFNIPTSTRDAASCAIVSYTACAEPLRKHFSSGLWARMDESAMTDPCLESVRLPSERKRENVETSVWKVPPVRFNTARSASNVSLSSQNMKFSPPRASLDAARRASASSASSNVGAQMISVIFAPIVVPIIT